MRSSARCKERWLVFALQGNGAPSQLLWQKLGVGRGEEGPAGSCEASWELSRRVQCCSSASPSREPFPRQRPLFSHLEHRPVPQAY